MTHLTPATSRAINHLEAALSTARDNGAIYILAALRRDLEGHNLRRHALKIHCHADIRLTVRGLPWWEQRAVMRRRGVGETIWQLVNQIEQLDPYTMQRLHGETLTEDPE